MTRRSAQGLRAVRHAEALIVAQPCPASSWTPQLIAVDDAGRRRLEHPNTEKVLARPR
ncbi:hypothetical protein [Streptomyces sp. NPDC001604]|uniref:hypothetical protein n=1 Tax=Streptomyces sp. NPDC001604 TaxID=3364593 RepID=UPI00369D51FB